MDLKMWNIMLVIFSANVFVLASARFTPTVTRLGGTNQDEYGYVEARPGAFYFFWLYYTTHPEGSRHRPWLIWLEGGPGMSGSGTTNFGMLGPEDEKGNTREQSWVRTMSVMYIDSPVGTGFSYRDNNETSLCASTEEVSQDLLAVYTAFTNLYYRFIDLPLYIFGQSYGGKMTVGFGYFLNEAIESGDVEGNLAGIGIGNGWVSPVDMVLNFAPLLIQMSLIDTKTYDVLMEQSEELKIVVERDGPSAPEVMDLWRKISTTIETLGIDIYDIMNPTAVSPFFSLNLSDFMNGQIRDQLEIIPEHVQWKDWSYDVYLALQSEFFESVVPWVESLLTKSNVDVIVYQGQQDLVCPTKGAIDWVNSMRIPDAGKYYEAKRIALRNPSTNQTEMYLKKYGHLHFYWILHAGHATAADKPDVMLRMINRVIEV